MRKRILPIIGLMACVFLTACGGSEPVSGAEMEQAAEQEMVSEQEMEPAKAILPSDVDSEADEIQSTFEEEALEGPVEDGTYEGIVTDAAMNSFSIYTEDGRTIYFGMPEGGADLKDGMLLGIPVRVVCEGGSVTAVTDGQKQPLAGREALEFAGSIMTAFRYRDMDTLTALIGYPVFVSTGEKEQEIQDAKEFESLLDPGEIFSKERRRAVLTVNLYALEELDGGKYVLGNKNGSPNVTFCTDQGNDRGFSVTGIH